MFYYFMVFTYISLFQLTEGFWESLKYKAQTSQKWKIIKMGKKTKEKEKVHLC